MSKGVLSYISKTSGKCYNYYGVVRVIEDESDFLAYIEKLHEKGNYLFGEIDEEKLIDMSIDDKLYMHMFYDEGRLSCLVGAKISDPDDYIELRDIKQVRRYFTRIEAWVDEGNIKVNSMQYSIEIEIEDFEEGMEFRAYYF